MQFIALGHELTTRLVTLSLDVLQKDILGYLFLKDAGNSVLIELVKERGKDAGFLRINHIRCLVRQYPNINSCRFTFTL
jgi:hypothetical protein